jgi:hypothetical protein
MRDKTTKLLEEAYKTVQESSNNQEINHFIEIASKLLESFYDDKNQYWATEEDLEQIYAYLTAPEYEKTFREPFYKLNMVSGSNETEEIMSFLADEDFLIYSNHHLEILHSDDPKTYKKLMDLNRAIHQAANNVYKNAAQYAQAVKDLQKGSEEAEVNLDI